MKKFLFTVSILALTSARLPAQTPAPSSNARQQPVQPQRQSARPATASFDLAEYGVQFSLQPRLVVVMAALDAAGFDPSPGKPASPFRLRVREDQSRLDPDLRAQMRRFYESHKLRQPSATPGDQAARYVSLAFALGQPPTFDAPPRADDLFVGVADVLDFAPLLREFYRRSGIEERLPSYLAGYRAEGDRLRRQTAEMVKTTLNYLHTRPVVSTTERVRVPPTGDKKKDAQKPKFEEYVHDRNFFIVPDPLAAHGAVNFRVVGDNYFVVIPPGTDPTSSEVRRAYLQYVVDPLIHKFNRDIALRRADIQGILDERAKLTPGGASAGVFDAVARSLVVAADARIGAQARLADLQSRAAARLQKTKESERAALTKEVQEERAAIDDEATAQLAEAYERGAVLAFYFAEELKQQESSGFDFSDAIPDVLARLDAPRELRRPEEYAAARARVAAAREKSAKEAATVSPADANEAARRAALIKSLDEVSRMIQSRDYAGAEVRLRVMLEEYKGEPRVFFALGQTWSAGAADAANDETRDTRLNNALLNYGNAIQSADRDNDLALISRSHVARGRILAFLERNDEALKEFDAAIKIGEVSGGAYNDALAAKKKLQP
ncbi:MAG: hypothetical protein LC785_03210 [Acidobacteria bacterium]|nr:hypothetical protein [Acidobacteriota bacterium]MCA1632856.1 hypothetical protein [Acidobacteriota bacterium]MCA1640992.1 hypothetical protein [Acidobacteriota bacterium]